MLSRKDGGRHEVDTEKQGARKQWSAPRLAAPSIDITAVKGAATSEDPTNLSASFS
jgi:hypothetical protein